MKKFVEKYFGLLLLAVFTMIVSAIFFRPAVAQYATTVYRALGGNELVVASGGTVTVQSGGTLTVNSGGSVNLPNDALQVADIGAGTLPSDVVASTTAADSVNSTSIADASIINADVNSSAAIAISKLATSGSLGAGVICSSVATDTIGEAQIVDSTVTHSKLYEEVELVVSTSITTAEVLALNASPITVIAAPGANKAIMFLGAVVLLDYVSAAYDGVAAGEDLVFAYTDGSGVPVAEIETTGFIDQTNDELRIVYPHSAASGSDTSLVPVANAPLVMALLSGEIATGDSPIDMKIYYKIVPTNL